MAEQNSSDDPLVDYSEDGIDLTLVRHALSLTPEERLIEMQNCVNSLEAIREENGAI